MTDKMKTCFMYDINVTHIKSLYHLTSICMPISIISKVLNLKSIDPQNIRLSVRVLLGEKS